MRVYLDVCCLNRPFDDQTQDRIHLETEAILTIMKMIESEKWILLNSDIIFYEIDKIPDQERKTKVRFMISKASIYIRIDEGIVKRAELIQKFGIKSYDALHIACAERGKSDIFLTTDDQLLKKIQQHVDKIYVKADNPLDWIRKVI